MRCFGIMRYQGGAESEKLEKGGKDSLSEYEKELASQKNGALCGDRGHHTIPQTSPRWARPCVTFGTGPASGMHRDIAGKRGSQRHH